MTTVTPITAYAAQFINGEQIGERIECRLTFTNESFSLDRNLSFAPAPVGVAIVRFFATPDSTDAMLELKGFGNR